MTVYLLFATTLLLGAALLFWVQPMIAKALLPLMGGAPAVWNVCLVFFQAMLLAGYAYAHFVATKLKLGQQAVLHLVLLLLPILFLPITIAEQGAQADSAQSSPAFWLLGVLFMTVGLPFFVVATTSPLLQRWFSMTGHAAAADPYFLYSASNIGSLAALLGYPALVEPNLRLSRQSSVWAAGYAILALLIALCAVSTWRRSRRIVAKNQDSAGDAKGTVTVKQRLRWLVFAFVPSSLMLGVTTYLTTDIASIPLLWVIPLGLYLLSFILVFARKPPLPRSWMIRALPIAAVALLFVILSNAVDPAWLLLCMHLVFFFIACMVSHGRLAADRPQLSGLTEFYFWMGLGGVLGGAFNALLAPILFNGVVEYPLAIVLACLARPLPPDKRQSRRHTETQVPGPNRPSSKVPAKGRQDVAVSLPVPQRFRWVDLGLALALGVFTVAAAAVVTIVGMEPGLLSNTLIFALPVFVCYTFINRPVRFGLAVAALLLSGNLYLEMHGRTIYADRNFFGISRVTLDETGAFHRLVHGNTTHGRQFIDPARQCEPLAYYHPNGPLGKIMSGFKATNGTPRIGVIGLGAGAMICYAATNQAWTFYEIDPLVIRVAQDNRLFTYLDRCAKVKPRIILGDARLRLREAPGQHYSLLVLDAFSSDSIPVHLLTEQAFNLYLAKLADGGMLAMHISNRYLDLAPVIGNLAKNAGLIALVWDDLTEDKPNGKEPSQWVVLARQAKDLGPLAHDPRWQHNVSPAKAAVWTDDFSNILSVFKWR
ncbi:MAG: spermidine synthase [Verrucomicrobia bacterium]|nr:spermidine synthase [Verrucomicrobiota bacterium]